MSPNDDTKNGGGANSPDGGPPRSSFQFGIAALLILTAAVAVILQFGEPFLRWLDDLGAPVEFALHAFVVLTSFACPYFLFVGVQILRKHRRYWVLAVAILAGATTVLATWLVLFLEIGKPEPDPETFLDLNVLGWAMSRLAVIFVACIVTAALAITIFHVLRAERRAIELGNDRKMKGQKNKNEETKC